MATKKALKPGSKAPISGQYERIGNQGKKTGIEVTSEKGNTLPPTPKKGQTYVPVDPTKNNSGKK